MTDGYLLPFDYEDDKLLNRLFVEPLICFCNIVKLFNSKSVI